MTAAAPRVALPWFLRTKKQSLLFLRWLVILSAVYLVLFSRPGAALEPSIELFVAIFLATNLVGMQLPERWFERTWLRAVFVLFDTLWISFGMVLAAESSSEFFLLYFSVLFLAALGESEAMIAAGSALISVLYAVFLVSTRQLSDILVSPVLLRFPFLFGVAIFYGYLVTLVKEERGTAALAKERERLRTDLLATLTHDLQTPLSAIAGMADLMLIDGEAIDEAERRKIFESIKKAATEGSELVATFLAMASAESASQTFARKLVDLNEIVRELVIAHHARAAAEKKVRLETRCGEPLPPISGNRAHLQRAVSNLIGNAIKFSPEGGVVEVTTAFDAGAVTLAVGDEGPGLPPAVRARLFEPYVADGAQSGTGLGLFIVRLVAEAHGGSVMFRSPAGRGSCFILRIPIPADVRV